MSREREEWIAAAAARQHGLVTRGQLTEAGFTRSGIRRRVQSGRLRPLHRGVYLTTPIALPHTRQMAAVLACGRCAVLSHASAGAFWQFCDAAKGDVEVSTLNNRRRRPGIRVYRVRRLPADEWTVHEGIPVTTPARTLLDIATVVGARELEAAVARAERAGLATPEELLSMLERHPRHVGVPALRVVLQRTGGPALTRSAAEEGLLAQLREAGLPPPECNARVGGHEVDMLWRKHRLIVEVDGFQYHSSRPSFEQDRRRDAGLIALGFTVLRLSWRQIHGEPLATVVRIAQALARARERS